MRAAICTVSLILVAGIVPAAAQDDFPPDPAGLFTGAVELVAADLIADGSTDVVADDDARLVRGFVDGVYFEYPYPEPQSELLQIRRPIWDHRVPIYDYHEVGGKTWTLDLETGQYELFEGPVRCDPIAEPFNGFFGDVYDSLWAVTVDESTGAVRLCDTVTAALTPPLDLPAGADLVFPYSSTNPNAVPLSPDLASALLFARADGEVHVFSYVFESGQARDLGDFLLREDFRGYWYDSTRFILFTEDHDACDSYVVDLDGGIAPALLGQPPASLCLGVHRKSGSLVATQTTRDPYPRIDTCQRDIYVIDSGERLQYHYGRLCYPDLGSYLGAGTYRDVSDDLRQADIVRFDVTTGEKTVLYTADNLEGIRWISPDEHSAVLAFDDDPTEIGLLPNDFDEGLNAYQLWLRFVDLQTGQTRYEVAVPADFTYSGIDPAPSSLDVLREPDLLLVQFREVTRSLIRRWDDSDWLREDTTLVVRLTDAEPVLTELPPLALVLQDRLQLVYWQTGDAGQVLYLYDIAGDTATALTLPLDPARYALRALPGAESDTLVLSLRRIERGLTNPARDARYTFRMK